MYGTTSDQLKQETRNFMMQVEREGERVNDLARLCHSEVMAVWWV